MEIIFQSKSETEETFTFNDEELINKGIITIYKIDSDTNG